MSKEQISKKIDFHIHVTPSGLIESGKLKMENEPYFSMLYNNNAAMQKSKKFATAEDVVAQLDDSGFDKAVIFGFAFQDIGLCRYVNDYVIESVKKFPKKLAGFCVVPPCKEAAKEIERCYSLGLCGVGELFPFGQKIDLEDKEKTRLITDICSELELPLLLHVNEQVGHEYAGKTEVPLKQIETFIKNNADLKIVLAHFGGGLMFYETMPEIKLAFKNVYYDTAAMPFLYDASIYNAIKALRLCGKVLFGSDFPLLAQSKYLQGFENCLLSIEDKKLILGSNAIRLLGDRGQGTGDRGFYS